MATKSKAKLAGHAFASGVFRLADIAPLSITVFTEVNDWMFVGNDLRDAMITVESESSADSSDSDGEEQLVEA